MRQTAATHWCSWKLLVSSAFMLGGCSASMVEPGWPPGAGQASTSDVGGSNPTTPAGPVSPRPPGPGGKRSGQAELHDAIGKGGTGTPPRTWIPGPPAPGIRSGGSGAKTPRPSDATIQRGGGQSRPRL